MEKDGQYFALERNIASDKKVAKLIEAHGPKGFGTYIFILLELHHTKDYRCSESMLKSMARKYKIGYIMIKQVLYGFGLFEITGEGEAAIVSSPYLDRVMEKYEEKVRKCSEAGKKNADTAKRGTNGRFTNPDGTLDKIRLDKNISTTTVTGKDAVVAVDVRNWERHLDEAVKDVAWMELLAVNSGFGRQFIGHTPFVVETFRRHVALQGSGTTIQSVSDAKAYFANFLRQGTPTQKRVAALLAEREELHRQTSVNRYETLDPATGERSYFGNPIPPDAPPRPNDNAVWSHEIRQWI